MFNQILARETMSKYSLTGLLVIYTKCNKYNIMDGINTEPQSATSAGNTMI